MEEAMNFHTSNLNHHCLVCGTDSLANYVDLTLITSRTSQSDTLVKERLKAILCDKWISPDHSEMSMVICLPCFHLVDQFDVLELQLQNIRDNLSAKYISTNGLNKPKIPDPPPAKNDHSDDSSSDEYRPPSPVVITTSRGRKSTTLKVTKQQTNSKKEKTSRRRKLSPEAKKSAAEAKKAAAEMKKAQAVAKKAAAEAKKAALEAKREKARAERAKKTWRQGATPDDAGTSRQGEDGAGNAVSTNENGNQMPHKEGGKEKSAEEEERERRMIYDEDPTVFCSGEKLRIGIMMGEPGATITYDCCYCMDQFGDTENLKVHVRTIHRPEILTMQIPVELGYGSKVNCGAQINNITATTDLSKPFVCIYCPGAFKFKSNINLHYKEKHTPYKPFACMDCNETFRRSMELSRHRVYYCPFSQKVKKAKKERGKEREEEDM